MDAPPLSDAERDRYQWQLTVPGFGEDGQRKLKGASVLISRCGGVGGAVAYEAPPRDLAWLLFFDSIHHRGQLSAYLHPMGGKVPSIYGPSADDPGGH